MAAEQARGNQNLATPGKPRVKILLADDSVTMHRAVRLALKNEPVEVLTCDNGQDALRLAIEHRPDVLLADLDMPGLTGPELVAAVKGHPTLGQTRAVLLCGSFDQVDESRLQTVAADARLWKPFEAHALVAMIHALLKTPPLRAGTSPTAAGVRQTAEKTGALPSAPAARASPESTAPLVLNPPPKPLLPPAPLPGVSGERTANSARVTAEITAAFGAAKAPPPPSARPAVAPAVSAPVPPDSVTQEIPRPAPLRENVDLTSPDLEKNLTQETFQAAETNSGMLAPRENVLPPPTPTSTSLFEDEWGEPSGVAQAQDNLWSTDFQQADAAASGSDAYAPLPPTPDSAPDALYSSESFEIVNPNDSPSEIYGGGNDDNETSPLSDLPSIDEELGLTSASAAEGAGALISADEWAKDRDFSYFTEGEGTASVPSLPPVPEHPLHEHPGHAAPVEPLSEEHVREWVRGEIAKQLDFQIQKTLRETAREAIQEQLKKVMQEIDRE